MGRTNFIYNDPTRGMTRATMTSDTLVRKKPSTVPVSRQASLSLPFRPAGVLRAARRGVMTGCVEGALRRVQGAPLLTFPSGRGTVTGPPLSGTGLRCSVCRQVHSWPWSSDAVRSDRQFSSLVMGHASDSSTGAIDPVSTKDLLKCHALTLLVTH